MNTSPIGRIIPLVMAAMVGGFISQLIPLTMQLHAQTNAVSATTVAPPSATAPAPVTTTTTREYGVVDITTLKTPPDIASCLDNAEKTGWRLKMGIANYLIFTKK